MEKTFTLDQKETAMLAQVDQERTQALAMVGALSLDMEQARKNLDTAAERQRSFIRQALSTRGVDRYENARAANGALIVTMPDEVPAPHHEGSSPKMVERVNGSPEVRE
jgi:hypothetical protein